MKGDRALLSITIGGMELSWLYAWATFLTTSILHQPFPLLEATGSFVLAAVLTRFPQGRGWRIIYVLILQAIGFVPALLRIVRVFGSWSYSFSNQPWLAESFNTPGASLDWFIMILVPSWAFFFWGGGIRLIWRPKDYFTLCSRFDRGLAAFFILFLVKFLFWVKGGIRLDDPISELMLFPFLVFSLLAIGLSRNLTTAPRDFLPGFQGIGVILSFTVVVLLFGSGLVFFFLPYLTLAAEKGYVLLKIAARPVGSLLLMVVHFLFGRGLNVIDNPPDRPEPSLPDLTSSGKSPWWLELLGKILAYGIWAILGLVLLMIIGVALYYLYRWLLSRTSIDQERESPWHQFLLWVERIRRFMYSFWRVLHRSVKGYKRALQFYAALLRWGRRSGLPRSLNETPTEYGSRLKRRFPSLNKEIGLIIEAFNQEVYGEISLNENQMAMAHSAWSRLRSPLHWPRRLKTWLLRPQDQNDPPMAG